MTIAFNVGAAEQHRFVLRLAPVFSERELKTAYRRLIREWHPDQFVSQAHEYAKATQRATEINLAYEFLSEVVEGNGGTYPVVRNAVSTAWTWSDLQPRRTYEYKTYTAGFPDPAVTEVFLRSSHIVSTGYDRLRQVLYIKFSGNSVYRYFDVPQDVFEDFMTALSHGKFGNQRIYSRYRQERC